MRLIYITTDISAVENSLKKQVAESEASQGFFDMMKMMINVNYQFERMIYHPDYVAIKNEKFDLVILGWCINDFLFGIASHFNAPLVLSVPNRPNSFIRQFTGNPNGISYVPAAFGSSAANKPMSFKERLANYVGVSFEIGMSWFLEYYVQRPLYNRNFPNDRYPTFDESKKNIALVLVSHHFSQGAMEAYLPAMVEVGGLHIKSEPSPLPKVLHFVLILLSFDNHAFFRSISGHSNMARRITKWCHLF